ncbi:MAG: hypothetical protein Q9163_002425 [Psora crenata]
MAPRKTAILSVYNKQGLLDLAQGLIKHDIRLLASGGTAKLIREAGLEVEDISAITHSPEILKGRVKTLHPKVHAGILSTNSESDEKDLAEQSIDKVDYVVCNLYPFKDTVAKINVTIAEAVEEIDIGGVTLIRAAAKNHERVCVLSDPADYAGFLQELDKGGVTVLSRQLYALKAFEHTADYDTTIADFFRKKYASDGRQQISLRYGANPHQKPAAAFNRNGPLPFKVLNGAPGYINLMDSLNAWPLVKELKQALGLPAAASFKHVSPAGAAIGVPMTKEEREVCMVDDIDGLSESSLAQAYARARGADRMSSFGDIIALSDEVDVPTAKIISREVSDGIIAPSYSAEAFEILSKKKGGKYMILQMDESYEPPAMETKTVYGQQLLQHRNDVQINPKDTFNTIITPKESSELPEPVLRDLTVATISVKYTQSNSVCYGMWVQHGPLSNKLESLNRVTRSIRCLYVITLTHSQSNRTSGVLILNILIALNGQVIGLGAGQQSRIHCTRLAGDKADNWWMRFHERVLNLKWKKGTKRYADVDSSLADRHVRGATISPVAPQSKAYFPRISADSSTFSRADKSNAIDLLCSGHLPKSDIEKQDYERNFDEVPRPFTNEEREEWLSHLRGVALSSDAFFPFIDNVLRASRSGVKYIACPTGSQADQDVFATCEKLKITFVQQSVRLFHH